MVTRPPKNSHLPSPKQSNTCPRMVNGHPPSKAWSPRIPSLVTHHPLDGHPYLEIVQNVSGNFRFLQKKVSAKTRDYEVLKNGLIIGTNKTCALKVTYSKNSECSRKHHQFRGMLPITSCCKNCLVVNPVIFLKALKFQRGHIILFPEKINQDISYEVSYSKTFHDFSPKRNIFS